MRNLNNIPKQKHIALIAHDNMKAQLLKWVKKNRDILANHFLCGTGTTSKMIIEETSLPVKSFESGPYGGDMQIGSSIVESKIDFMVFFWDPLTSQPHDPDVKALLRVAVLYDIPIAMNVSTADFLLNSTFMDKVYERSFNI